MISTETASHAIGFILAIVAIAGVVQCIKDGTFKTVLGLKQKEKPGLKLVTYTDSGNTVPDPLAPTVKPREYTKTFGNGIGDEICPLCFKWVKAGCSHNIKCPMDWSKY